MQRQFILYPMDRPLLKNPKPKGVFGIAYFFHIFLGIFALPKLLILR